MDNSAIYKKTSREAGMLGRTGGVDVKFLMKSVHTVDGAVSLETKSLLGS